MKLELKLSINMDSDRNTPNFQSENIGCKQGYSKSNSKGFLFTNWAHKHPSDSTNNYENKLYKWKEYIVLRVNMKYFEKF